MKSDLDALMGGKDLQAILVLGSARHNPPMYYLLGGGLVSHAVLLKKVGQAPVLYCNAMEREEAAKTGLKVVPLASSPVDVLAKNPKEILETAGIDHDRVGVYGTLDAGNLIGILEALRSAYPNIQVVGEPKADSIFLRAMETKDAEEIEHIRKMGRITTEVVGLVSRYLSKRDVRADEVLLDGDGQPLTIGAVKQKIALWLAERGAEQAEGCIFAIGRDAGIPHSAGTPNDLLRLGQTIVFDIFPSEAGGGYSYDFTRTWSLGYASPEARALYAEVRTAYETVTENLDLNASFKGYQKLVCEQFHRAGHATPMHDQGVLENGYVHSLGHGVGLNLHERPWSRHSESDDNTLRAGVVFTIEPGLYYPEKGLGVRIEDTYYVRPDGSFERLADFPYDLVLPMEKWRPDPTRADQAGSMMSSHG
jgi:Xaa-Pro aminopeptidase